MRSYLPHLLLALACASAPAAAQQIAYPGIPWETPVDVVRTRVEAQGFELDSVLADGDQVYRRRDGSWLKAYLRGGWVVGITVIDPARRPAVDARFRALADSMEAVLGAPALREAEEVRWEAALTELSLYMGFARGPQAELRWRGPGWYDEMHRRRLLIEAPPLPRGFTIVHATPVSFVSVDTATLARQPGGVLRGRFRIDYAQAVGMDAEPYDAAEYEMEFDCAGGRTRLLRRTTFLAATRRHDESFTRIPWAAPSPGNHAARGLSAVCRAAGR
jgi:hypothetical protein